MNTGTYLQFLLALIFVIGLIAGLGWLVRRYGLGGKLGVPRSGKKRLDVIEVTSLDAKRRLVLVRRDGIEHLLLVGGATELVVERGIAATPHAAVPSPTRVKETTP